MDERLNKLEERLSKLENDFHDIDKSSALLEQKLDNIIDSIDNLTKAIKDNQIEQSKKIEKLEIKVDRLEQEINEKTTGKDAANWQKVIGLIITGIVSALVGAFVALFNK